MPRSGSLAADIGVTAPERNQSSGSWSIVSRPEKRYTERSMADLFDQALEGDIARSAPLADRLRPHILDHYVGQDSVIGPGTILRLAVDNDELFSMILWGPPGSGKTSMARIIAEQTKAAFVGLSGVLSSKDDLLRAVRAAEELRKFKHQRTILFVDEIHRWNKAQQDALLPYVENGVVTLIGATTENPSFEVIAPLLSRCQVVVLERLSPEHLDRIVDRALTDDERGFGREQVTIEPVARAILTEAANGDARTVLNILELAYKATRPVKGRRHIVKQTIIDAYQRPNLRYDKGGEEHYNVISAFIKSMRGSNPDAALYWLGRMVEAGEDPLFIARRMVVFASEDVSMADAHALPLAIACMQACDLVGYPECAINLAHVAVYLASCPKSNETYVAFNAAREDVRESLNEPVPLNLRNASTKLMKDLGYHRGYKYSHDFDGVLGDQQYLPERLNGKTWYHPKRNPFQQQP